MVDGYDLTPPSVDEVVMDSDKTLNFTATAISPEGLTPVTDVELIGGVVQDANNYSWDGTEGVGYVISNQFIPSGEPFRVVFDGDPSAKSATLAVSDTPDQQGENAFVAGIKWEPKSVNQGLFSQTSIAGGGETDYTGRTFTGTPKGFMIGDGTRIRIYRNMNGDGETLEELFPATIINQPSVDLYIKMLFYQAGLTVKNVVAEGLT